MRLPPVTEELRTRWETADPFPHLVIHGIFGLDLCERAASEFPHPDDPGWHTFTGPLEQGKQEGRAEIAGPAVARIHEHLASEEFVIWLRDLTGIDLIADPYRTGGGIHQVRKGGRLGFHTDYSLMANNPAYERRVNTILFVSDAPWAGAELWLLREPDGYRSITPTADALVVFVAEDGCYHGHPTPMEPPTPDDVRRSIPAYFFAPARPGTVERSTKFLERA